MPETVALLMEEDELSPGVIMAADEVRTWIMFLCCRGGNVTEVMTTLTRVARPNERDMLEKNLSRRQQIKQIIPKSLILP